MSSKPRSPAPIPRIPGLGFVKLARRLSNSSARRSREADITPNDDDWYIPYNGTYEPPKATLKHKKERDSWGDPIYGDDDEEGTTVASLDSPIRYHPDRDAFVRGKPCRDSGLGSEDQRTSYRHRSNTHSAITGQTTLCGTLQSANRASYSTKRRSTVHSRPPMPSYINLDAAGGVGASPAPPPIPERKRSPSKEAKTLSVTSIFSGTSLARRKSLSSSAGSIFRKLSRGPPPSPSLPSDVKNDKHPRSHRRSSSDSTHMLTRTTSPLRRGRVGAPAIEESHHRYGTTQKLVDSTATSKDPFSDHDTHAPEPTPAPAPARHPYASVFPVTQQFDEPRTAPLPGAMTSQGQASSNYKTLPRGAEFASSSSPRPHFGFLTSRTIRFSKNSASTPDLRLLSYSQAKEKEHRAAGKSAGGSKDRWLSPETWCDALLFPRPRLKMKLDSEVDEVRPMSTWGFPEPSNTPEPRQAVASRVLAQSQSHHNLRVPRTSPQKVARREGEPGPSRLRTTADEAAERRASRPKSFSWDDMALPTPVPSLTKVLEEGERLDSERKEWQHQATHSFQNRRSRSVSRARSKSLTQKGPKRQESWAAENMDFLAARACLGKQIDMPSITIKIITPDSPQKSPSKKAKHHKHTHTDSWSRSAFKNTQPVNGRGGAPASHQKYPSADTGSTTSTGPLRRGETRVVQQPDPARPAVEHLAPSENSHNARYFSVSPSPSGTSAGDVRMGIALSTPPMLNNAEDMESLSMPSHPYAQGGVYTSRHYVPTQISHSPGSGPNTPSPTPSQRTHERDGTPTQGSPQYLQFSHPYAQRSPSQNSYISEAKILPVPRLDSDIPPPAKMWIPVAPGLVTEVLPGEISYSPFLPEHEIGDTQNSEDANSTVEMGEVLALNSDPQVDSVSNHPYSSELPGRRPSRQPVQYDTSRPYLNHTRTPDTARTIASSGLLRADSDPATQLHPPLLPRQESSGSGSGSIIHIRTTSTSPESPSPPVSPRPFDNPDALDNFHDLFYRSRHQSERQSQATVSSFTSGSRSRRGGSGLTSLARQISEELMELEMEREREGSQYSYRASFDRPSIGPSRRPTGSSLEFVFEENPRLGIAPGEETGSTGGPIASTFSSIGVPEDVESSRASSPLDPHIEEDNETEEGLVQVRSVEPFLTPPAVFSPQRTSMTGHLSIPEDHEEVGEEEDQRIIDYNLLDHTGERDSNLLSPGTRYSSGHRRFSVDLLRSSYITTSTMSRMSGLSDFPEPPTIPTGSMLNNFFDKPGDTPPSPPPPLPIRNTDDMATIKRQRRLTLGGIEEDYSSTAPSSPVSPTSHASSRS